MKYFIKYQLYLHSCYFSASHFSNFCRYWSHFGGQCISKDWSIYLSAEAVCWPRGRGKYKWRGEEALGRRRAPNLKRWRRKHHMHWKIWYQRDQYITLHWKLLQWHTYIELIFIYAQCHETYTNDPTYLWGWSWVIGPSVSHLTSDYQLTMARSCFKGCFLKNWKLKREKRLSMMTVSV